MLTLLGCISEYSARLYSSSRLSLVCRGSRGLYSIFSWTSLAKWGTTLVLKYLWYAAERLEIMRNSGTKRARAMMTRAGRATSRRWGRRISTKAMGMPAPTMAMGRKMSGLTVRFLRAVRLGSWVARSFSSSE